MAPPHGGWIRASSLLLVACSACERADPGQAWEARPAALVIEAPVVLPLLHRRLPLVMARIAGEPARVLLDTGAEITMLDRGFVDRTGLATVRINGNIVSRREGEVARRYEHFVDGVQLELGSAYTSEPRPLVFEMEYLGIELDAIVGMDVLGGCGVVFDAQVDQVRLVPSDQLRSHLGELFAEGVRFACLPWEAEGPRGFLEIVLEDELSFDILLDTGAVYSSFPATVVEALGLERSAQRTGRHIGGVEQGWSYRLEQLELGDTQITELDLDVWDEPTGVLGYGVLRNYVFVIDGVSREFCFAFQPERLENPAPVPVDGQR